MSELEYNAPKLLSLFCGAGGMDRGFEDAGFQTCLAIDKCPDAVRTFNRNSRNAVAVVSDLEKLKTEKFLELIPPNTFPVGIIGGPPCQGFSVGNVAADPNDPRNRLPYRYADLVSSARERYNLKFFVFENVPGLQNPKHSARFERILERLSKAGFNTFYKQLNAADYGVPQTRQRLFIVGLNRSLYPNHEYTFPESEKTTKTVKETIGNLPDATFFSHTLKADEIPFHPNHWTSARRSQKFASKIKKSAVGRSFRLLDWNSPSPTVAYGNREIHIHPNGSRRLTIYEAMLLQGFDPEFVITGNFSAQVTQVSNAVPPPVANKIAISIDQLLKLTDVARLSE